MKLPFEIIDSDHRRARVIMRAPLAQCPAPSQCGSPREPVRHSLFAPTEPSDAAPSAPAIGDLTPHEADYIYPLFRALSQTIIEGYWIDYSRPGVLEASTPLLAGQTVYADHHFWNVERWLGVVNEASWDADGAHSGGVPGINVELKIDALLNPRIARGLLMQPPAIHSASVTVVFEYEYSHPDLIDDGRFWDLLGEDVAGEIVRLIATKILGYWELSLVFQGADRSAKQLPPPPAAPAAAAFALLPAEDRMTGSSSLHPAPDGAPDRPLVLTPAPAEGPELQTAAAAGRKLLQAARAECRRLATVATLGGGDGQLPAALVSIIENADADQLLELTEMYRDQAAGRFARSSIEPAGANAIASAPPDRGYVNDTTLL